MDEYYLGHRDFSGSGRQHAVEAEAGSAGSDSGIVDVSWFVDQAAV